MKLVIVSMLVAVIFLHVESSGSQLIPVEKYGVKGPLRFLSGENKAVNCTGISGSVCSDEYTDCKNVYVCIPGVGPVPSECQSGLTCNQGKCTATPSPLCEYEELKFQCNTVGMYPEPSSCKKYNICPPGQKDAIQGECESGFAYNPSNTLCDKVLPNNVCTDSSRVVPPCLVAGQNAALKGNTALYYICLPHPDKPLKLYPNIYKCPGNSKYAGNYKCK